MPTVTQKKIDNACRQMGTKHLRRDLRDDWSPDNPTRNYCYVIAEFVYWYVAPPGSISMELAVPGDKTTHRFVVTEKGKILDYAANQFRQPLDYSQAKRKNFMQTGGAGPSARARLLAKLVGFEEDAWKNT